LRNALQLGQKTFNETFNDFFNNRVGAKKLLDTVRGDASIRRPDVPFGTAGRGT
jgi:hypothetical protein